MMEPKHTENVSLHGITISFPDKPIFDRKVENETEWQDWPAVEDQTLPRK